MRLSVVARRQVASTLEEQVEEKQLRDRGGKPEGVPTGGQLHPECTGAPLGTGRPPE